MRKTWLTAAGLIVGALLLAWWLRPPAAERDLPALSSVPVPEGGGTLVVDLVDGATDTDLAEVSRVLGSPLRWLHPLAVDEALAVGSVQDYAVAIARLRGHPLVEIVEPEQTLDGIPEPTPLSGRGLASTVGFPNDPLYEKQWNLRMIGAEQAWSGTPRGRGVIVAVLDTGVSPVEDLAGTRVLEGASFVPSEPTARDYQGHGTHVAGTIAQTTHNGVGVAGVAPEATILPIKVLSRHGSGQSSWIAAGIDHAVDQGAQVINLSLGSPVRSRVIELAIRKARARGVLVVAAAGNSGRQGVHYPGAFAETIGVSAVGPDGQRAPYSSYGQGVDLAAPGGDKRVADGGILQDTVGPGGEGHRYASFQGTSMATPHVAGAAAVLLSAGLAPDEVERRLLSTARGQGWEPQLGNGVLDLAAALGGIVPVGSPFRALLGLVLGLLVGRLSGASLRWVGLGAVTAALTAGGFFVLAWLPVDSLLVRVLSTGVLHWPAALGAPGIVGFPVWLSAALPVVVALFAGAFRPTRALAMGFALGVGAHLLHGAVSGELAPWWLGALSSAWLVVNATVCAVVGMALAGAEKLERGET